MKASSHPRTALLSLSTLVLFGPAAAAQVLVVDDDGGPGIVHREIASAVLSATPGTTLLVKEGTYQGFQVTGKGLVITAERGAEVLVNGGIGIHDLPADQSLVLHGLQARANPAPAALTVNNCAGAVLVEDGAFFGSDQPFDLVARQAGVIADSHRVSVHRCLFQGGSALQGVNPAGPGMMLWDSTVYLFASRVNGGTAHDMAFTVLPPTEGIEVHSSFLYAQGCVVRGGDGGSGVTAGPGCLRGGPGGAGMWLHGADPTPAVTTHDTFVFGGQGGPTETGCSPGPSGPDFDLLAGTVTPLQFPVGNLSAEGPLRSGETLTVSLTGAGGTTFLGVALAQDPVLLPGTFGTGTGPSFFLGGPSILDFGSLVVVPLGMVPFGTAAVQFPVPAISGLSLEAYVQAVTIRPAALPTSSLTSAQGVTILDPAL